MRLAVCLLAVGWLGGLFPPRDFVEYWSAARVAWQGGNPYDDSQLLVVQREALQNPELQQPVLLWTPPWTLPLYLPWGLLPFELSHVIWIIGQVGSIAISLRMLRQVYWSELRTALLLFLIPVLYSPVFWCLHFGQNTGFLLLGVSGFLFFRTRNRPILAGMFAALTAIKPHLLGCFGIVLILDALTRNGRRALLAGMGTIAVSTFFALLVDPALFTQFAEALRRPTSEHSVHLAEWEVPLLSYHLRWAINPQQFTWQFLPCMVAIGIAAVGFVRMRSAWNWPKQMPWLVLASAVTAPYGGWIFDLTILILPIFAVLATLAQTQQKLPVTLYILGMLMLSWSALRIQGLADSLWHSPGVLVLSLIMIWWARHAHAQGVSSPVPS